MSNNGRMGHIQRFWAIILHTSGVQVEISRAPAQGIQGHLRHISGFFGTNLGSEVILGAQKTT